MLDLNVTLFIQIINFFITWFLFDRLILRDAFHKVIQEEYLEHKIHEDQRLAQQYLDDQFMLLQEDVEKTNKQLLLSVPEPSFGFIPMKKAVSLQAPKSTLEQRNGTKALLVDAIVKMVKDGERGAA